MTKALSIRLTAPYLGKIIGLSVSESEDLGKLGFLPRDTKRVLADVVTQLVYRGGRIGYGGDLRSDDKDGDRKQVGYTMALFRNSAESYPHESLGNGIPRFIHFAALPVWSKWSPTELFEHVCALSTFGEVRLFLEDGSAHRAWSEREADAAEWENRSKQPQKKTVTIEFAHGRAPNKTQTLTSADQIRQLWTGVSIGDAAAGLTAMRRSMAKEIPARILLGGRVTGYTGAAPGVAEEALLTLEQQGLVLPIAVFGGAAHDVAHALGLLSGPPVVDHKDVGPGYREVMEKLHRLAPTYRKALSRRSITKNMLSELSTCDVPGRLAAVCQNIVEKFFMTKK